MSEPIQQFLDALAGRGIIVPPDFQADGAIHRCDAEGPGGKGDAAYLLHLDGIAAGGFENHRDGLGWQSWRADIGRPLSYAEEAAHKAKIAEARAKREAEDERRKAEARERAEQIRAEAGPCHEHDYLTRKGIKAHGAKLYKGSIALPLRDTAGVLHSLQFIDANGGKKYLSGGRVRGCYFGIGRPDGVLCIAEGLATGASIHEATGHAVAVAFDAGNLLSVAQALRQKFPDLKLILCADDDYRTDGNPGQTKAIEAAQSVGGLVAMPDFGPDRPEGLTDFNDLHQEQGIEAVRRCIDAALAGPPMDQPEDTDNDTSSDDEEGGRQSQASALVVFVEQHADLFHDKNSDVYVQDRLTHETRRLEARQFRDWLVASFYQKTGKSPRDQSVREALSTLAGLGRFKGECRDVHVRVAMIGDAYFLDLAEAGKSRAVKIVPGSWEITIDPPVRFIRPETMRPLPEPVGGGDMTALWTIANIPDNSRLLVLAWLAECLRPDTPFPVLELIGEQGSAKSTTQAALRRLIDPNACDLRAAPKAVEDVYVSAGANWLVSYENISHLSAAMQDALCVLATGGGHAKRKLYSDAEESVIVVKRPIVLNGISAAVTAQDLIDRTMSVETPVIVARQETSDIWRTFDAAHGQLLGALLDIIAGALKRLPNVKLPPEDRPRLVEFAHLGMAIAETVGLKGSDFMAQFQASRLESIARTIDASPVATAVIDWFEDRGKCAVEIVLGNLFTELERKKPPNTDAWPRTAKGLGDALRRAAPALRQLGIECKSMGKSGSTVKWKISPRGNLSNQSRASREVVLDQNIQHDMTTFTTSCRELSPVEVNRIEVEI